MILENIITTVIVAIPTGYLSAFIAIRRHRTEKWWDLKLSCYLETVNSLNKIIIYCDHELDVELDEVEVYFNDDQVKLFETDFHEARLHLQSQLNSGRLLFNHKAYTSLLKFSNSLFSEERNEDITKRITTIREEAENCINIMVNIAKKDLKV